MDEVLFNRLHAEGLISGISLEKINVKRDNKLFSVHWEIKTLLYLGVLLLSGGLGILVYKNIDSIGHQAILLFIATVCAGSFLYCYKHKLPYANGKVASPNSFFDYILLLACCTFIIFIAYLQYQYNLFGSRYGLATFFPMLVLFFSAYYFDHTGILSLAITNLAAWLGLTVTPLEILTANDFNEGTLILTGIFLGVLLLLMGHATRQKNIKRHFEFTYDNFGTHILLISCIAAMIHYSLWYLLWFLLLLAIVYYFYTKAINIKSFYFILIITLYTYIATSYVVLNLLFLVDGSGMAQLYIGFLYFIASGIGLVLFLIRSNKKIKAHGSI